MTSSYHQSGAQAARERARQRAERSSDIDLAAALDERASTIDDDGLAYAPAFMREAALRLRQYAAQRAAAAEKGRT